MSASTGRARFIRSAWSMIVAWCAGSARCAIVVLCQEDAQASCCARDGGRPSGAALQEEASNCHELLRSKAAVVLCQEDAQASCCARDGGRPSGAALQEEASNCHELLRSKAAVVLCQEDAQ